ncbi:MAG: copper resistance protein NlpE N-terminal domain-containing protein [Saprospiraceae bacterium]|nr:copper resistance protein NlpE N-terminal domain-containing protein [Saprospiraceae bacterium]
MRSPGLLPLRILFALCFFTISCHSLTKVSDGHVSRNSLDWSGLYQGIFPCADCEGIETIVQLFNNESYELAQKYLGKDSTVFRYEGSFEWDKAGNKIILETRNSDTNNLMFQVGENQLTKLDIHGQKIVGELANNYILKKVN